MLEAAEIISKKGWYNGKNAGTSGRCLALSIMDVFACLGDVPPPPDDYFEVLIRIKRHLNLPIKNIRYDGLCDLFRWNDTHTKDEVLDLLRTVAYNE
jgi:hypothetical protein